MFDLIFVQATENPIVQMTWSLLLLTGAVGIVTTFVMQGLKKATKWLDGVHPTVKQLIVVVIAEVLAIASKFLGVALPADLAGFDVATVQAVLASGFSMGLYTVLKAVGLIKPKA